ncbi:MAG: hypothetical protein J5629_09905 [Muribaculaceae bacterium]|nr:hypothetical protein [Muribaculaceae bacterium]
MTKRTLFIIIGLLVLLDVAAIIIYLSAPNREGKSPLDTTYDNINKGTHTQADVLPDKASLDEFETIGDSVNFISTDKVEDGGEMKRMSSTVIINLQWPKKINGSNQFMELQNALMTKLTGKTYPSVKQMMADLTNHPKFVKPTTHFTRINKDFSASRSASHTTRRYSVQPHFGTHFRLEIMVVTETLDGGQESRTFSIIHYDRTHGKIITIDQIFDTSSTRDVLALINQSIENKMIKQNIDMHEVESIPKEFVLGEKHVIFYVEQDSKQYEVKVSNEDLTPYFTDYYNDLIINDTKLVLY